MQVHLQQQEVPNHDVELNDNKTNIHNIRKVTKEDPLASKGASKFINIIIIHDCYLRSFTLCKSAASTSAKYKGPKL